MYDVVFRALFEPEGSKDRDAWLFIIIIIIIKKIGILRPKPLPIDIYNKTQNCRSCVLTTNENVCNCL